MLDELLKHEVFDVKGKFSSVRNKDYLAHFRSLETDSQNEIICSFVYGVDNIKLTLYDLLEIAEGNDRLNSD